MKPSFHNWADDGRLKGLVLLVLTLGAVALMSYTYLSIKQAKYADSYGPTTISVDGKGEVTKVPDVATFSFSVYAEAKEPAAAQNASAEKVNAILVYLKEQGVAEADIKTQSYFLSPKYRPQPPFPMDVEIREEIMPIGYTDDSTDIIGYTADQNIMVKVRDTAKAGDLIAGVGERGATNVGSLAFTIDDDTNAKAEARAKAVAAAKEKAQQLADILGVRLVRLTGFWEETGGYPMYDKGYGDDMVRSDGAASPDMPVGENTVTSAVNLTYEIR